MHFFLEFAEGTSLCRFVLFKELEHLLDALTLKLLTDGVQVTALVLPEFELGEGVRVATFLESLFGILAKLRLDLLGPVADGIFQNSGFVL